MAYYDFVWTDEIVEHFAEHGITPDEFEAVVRVPDARGISRSSGRPFCWGESPAGRHLLCVCEKLDAMTILPVTAFEVPLSGKEEEH